MKLALQGLLALLLAGAWANRYSPLFSKIILSLDTSMAESRKHFNESMRTSDMQHSDLKFLVNSTLNYLENIVSAPEEGKGQVENFTGIVAEKIKQWKEQTEIQNRNFLLNREQQMAEIKNVSNAIMKKYGSEARDCYELYQMNNHQSGVYTIMIQGVGVKQVYCDMEDDGGGWTVIQRRDYYADTIEEFKKGTWEQFKTGFGNPEGEFWLGNEYINKLTSMRANELKIDMKDFQNATSHAHYGEFYVDGENSQYKLHLYSAGNGSASSFSKASGKGFQTYDRRLSCSDHWGGWWYDKCNPLGNLNGKHGNIGGLKSITFDGETPLSNTVMKIRPRRKG